ncbi:hypothetical protein HUN39_04700 [Methylocystis sp. FS]|uniref:hypothetical protein n=1 Tax=Methylocystis silviterrae TaxID=2743612 RepID=UPI00158342B3|nr:hypothetical protein [Methylocystis silviterrae]NUJ79338.1 hypothetical protein [Methylocystis silviterrae]
MGAYGPLIAGAALVVAGVVVYALRRYVYGKLAEGGAAAERATRAQADLAVAKRQGEIMAQHKDVENVAKDLDAGGF